MRGRPSRHQHGGQQPARLGAGHGQIVAVNRQQIGSNLGRREGDGIGGGDQEFGTANVDDGGVLAGFRSHEHRRVAARDSAQHLAQQR